MSAHDFGRVADIYDATRSLPQGEMRTLLDAFEANVPRGPHPLADFGVGTGRFAKPLQERGYEVVGLDISKRMMAKAREKGVSDLFFADAHRTPFRDEVFDSVLFVHVLHLVLEWVPVVREAARVARRSVVSAIEENDGNGPRQEYRRLRVEMGYPDGRLRGGERGLMERVSPEKVVQVLEARREVKADDEIDHLEQRGQSLTFDIPDGPHAEIIARLRKDFGGTTLSWTSVMRLTIWSAPSLRAADLGTQKG